MNKIKRKALELVISKLEEIMDEIEQIKDEEQDYANNMPENLQESEKHEAAEENVYNLEDAAEKIGFAIDAIQEAIDR